MKSFLFLVVFLITQVSFAAVNNTQNIFQGGGPIDGLSVGELLPASLLPNAIVLTATGNASGSNFIAVQAIGGVNNSSSPVQYQIGTIVTGKKFCASGFYYQGSGGDTVNFGYGTSALAASPTASAPTGNQAYGSMYLTSSAYKWHPFPGICFPVNDYPYFKSDSGGRWVVTLVGLEQ
jgi:hypothetical protein